MGEIGVIYDDTHRISEILLKPDNQSDLPSKPAPAPIRKLIDSSLRSQIKDDILAHVDLSGLSPFTQKIYHTLLDIPPGTTISYKDLAHKAGRPKASRAVGRAMATNPYPILIACHRVLASDGSLGGYGGGLRMKEKLLAFEKTQALTTAR